jgi:drug/metabolite transporter (DMT)-like permease
MALVYVLSLGAALLFGLGSVLQQREASQAPPDEALRLRLLWRLVRRPLWLAGVATALVGNLMTGAALALGSVALVQPLLVARLLFALPLAAAWAKQKIPRRDLLAALATAVGLGVFLFAGAPEAGEEVSPSVWRWLLTGALIGGLAVVLVTFARRLRVDKEAPMLGVSAGMLFGLQAGLTDDAVSRIADGGFIALVTAWTTYAVPVVAISGTLLLQSAYQMAPLTASYPSLSAVEPLAGIAIGLGVLGGTLRFEPVWVAVEVAALVVMTLGIYLLARSPLVTGEVDLLVAQQEEGRAVRLEEQIHDDLSALAAALDRLQRPEAAAGAERDRHNVDRHRAAADRCLDELRGMQRSIVQRREAELQKCERAPAPDSEVERRLRVLDERLRDVDERAERLRQWSDELEQRARDVVPP